MTIEDLPDFPLEESSVIGRYPFLFPGSDASVVFSVSAAPMPSDCGTWGGRPSFLWAVTGPLPCVLLTRAAFPGTVCCGFHNMASFRFSEIQWLVLPLNLHVLFPLSAFLLCKNVHFKHRDGFRGSYFQDAVVLRHPAFFCYWWVYCG